MQEREQGEGVLIYRHLFRAYKGCSRIYLVDQSERENNISLELIYLRVKMCFCRVLWIWILNCFMNLNESALSAHLEWMLRTDAQTVAWKENWYIERDNKEYVTIRFPERFNNSNYDPAARYYPLPSYMRFRKDVLSIGRAWLCFLSFYYESICVNSLKSAYVSG